MPTVSMKTEAKTILPLVTLAVVLFAMAPVATASTLKVDLNPSTRTARVNSVSTTKIVFTYPANSLVSSYLRNVNSSRSLTGSFDGNTQGAVELQNDFDEADNHVTVSNMSISSDYTAVGSATELVVNKVTNVTAWVSGVFTVVNGSVVANLGWRSFLVRGAWNLPMDGQSYDINLVGSTMQYSLSSDNSAGIFLSGMFGEESIWNRPTLNYSALSSPLSTWTKNYDAATNTTTFSKTISGQYTFTASVNNNGQNYSLSMVSDPSGVVAVQGYANANGDSLVMAASPASMATTYLALGVVAVIVVVGAGYFVIKSRKKTKPADQSLPV